MFVAAGIAGSMLPAAADKLVCVTIYYRVHNGPPQYVLNNFCQIPTVWGPLTGVGPSCGVDTNDVDVCYTVIISGP